MCDILQDWMEACSELIPARLVLGIMAFLALLFTQMIRANLYISIVGMVSYDVRSTNSSDFVQYQSSNSTILPEENDISPIKGFEWDEATQGIIFSAFYWCYWLTELPGGVMAQKWGGRKVLGVSIMVAALLNAMVPMACKVHLALLAVIRAVQGLSLGVTWPAVHTLAGCWIPIGERSKFMTVYHGAAVGTALTYPLCGFLINKYGWESTFYVIAVLNILWSIGCWVFIYDTPAKHPRITTRERKYLHRHLLSQTDKKNFKTPWWKIFKSRACWAVFAASQGVMWCTITLSMQLPTYFKNILKFDTEMNGILSGIPELSKFGFGLCFSALMDYLLHWKVLSLTCVRKISVSVCEYIPAALLLIFSFTSVNKSPVMAVVIVTLASAFGGASSAGSLANIVDISPNFAGVILGLIKTLSMIPGILSPMVAGILTSHYKAETGWSIVFTITAIIHIVCCTLFLLFGTADIQPWNDGNTSKDDKLLELQKNEEADEKERASS